MNYFIGIDLGTSAVKVLLVSKKGIEKSVSESYPVASPLPGYSEQNPLDWYDKTIIALNKLLENTDRGAVRSISFSGQMHGLVLLDKNDTVIRPAILWNDSRSVKETEFLNKEVGTNFLLTHTGNIAFAGFTAPKLIWVKNNEPENFARIKKIMLPKDYLAYCFSGEFCTDVSDASGTLYFDTQNRRWSQEMTDLLEIKQDMLPTVLESDGISGNISQNTARLLGLHTDVKIVIGAGDNAASAIGTGAVTNGSCNISLGTSGTIFVSSDGFSYDKNSAIHLFCSATGKYHYLACILSAASAQKWWIENILQSDYNTSNMQKFLGCNDVLFLPYLTGERSPINNPLVRSTFYGMTPFTERTQMSLAVLEGVAFALRQNLDILHNLGVLITSATVCGGGTRNALWLQVLANILNIELRLPVIEQGGASGAALLAAKAVLDDNGYHTLCNQFYQIKETVSPISQLAKSYDEQYRRYIKLSDAVIKLVN